MRYRTIHLRSWVQREENGLDKIGSPQSFVAGRLVTDPCGQLISLSSSATTLRSRLRRGLVRLSGIAKNSPIAERGANETVRGELHHAVQHTVAYLLAQEGTVN